MYRPVVTAAIDRLVLRTFKGHLSLTPLSRTLVLDNFSSFTLGTYFCGCRPTIERDDHEAELGVRT